MANSARLLLGFAITTWVAAQEPGAQPLPATVQIGLVPGGFTLDGELTEWVGPPDAVIDRKSQVWQHPRGGEWLGPDDLSARFWIRYDPTHLVLAGQIRDDSLVAATAAEAWESGDAIELFLDLDLGDDAQVDGQRRFDADDLQLFLMPMSDARPWGAIDFVAARAEGREARPNPFGVNGVRLARKLLPGTGYSFEAVVPLHNFPALRPGTREVGFNLALDDWDQARDRYQYLTWVGRNTVDDTRHLGRLQLIGDGFLIDPGGGGANWFGHAADYLPFVLLPLLIGVLLLLLARLWRAAQRHAPILRVLGRVLGIALFVGGLLLPGIVLGLRERGFEERRHRIVTTLQEDIPRMQRGTLASYTGAPRDAALVTLLSGGRIARKRSFEHRFLADLLGPADASFGGARKIYPSGFEGDRFPVIPYWIPLPRDQVQRFEFGRPLGPGQLAAVVSQPGFADSFDFDYPTVRITFTRADGSTAAPPQDVEFTRAPESASAFNQARRVMTFERVEVPESATGIGLTTLAGDDVQLVGLTAWPAGGGSPQPLSLGQTSLGGIRSDLRAGHPEDAGIELYPGSPESRRRSVRLARGHGVAYQKLWLFYRARYPSRGGVPLELAPGAEVAKVTIQFEGGVPERAIALTHQQSVLFELVRNNSVDAPQDEATGIAFRWEDQEQEQRINLVHEVDLPDGAIVDEIRFENTGPYEIRFRSVVFGLAQDELPFDLRDSPLELADRGRSVALRPSWLERLGPAAFSVYRGGRLTESTLPEAARAARQVLPRAVQRAPTLEQPWLQRSEDGDERGYEAFVTLPGEGSSGAVLHVLIADPAHGAVTRRLVLVGFAMGTLAAPILLLLLGELVVAIRNLRLRLLTVLTVATLTPVAVLSLSLLQVLETRHENELRAGLSGALATASRVLRDRQEQLGVAAVSWHPALLAEFQALRGELDDSKVEATRMRIEKLLQSQSPPDWQSSYLRFEAVPTPGAVGPTLVAAHGDATLWAPETQLRPPPAGLYLTWGVPVLGVYVEKTVGRWSCRLSVVRRLDESVLTGLVPNHAILLTDLRGYPLVAVGGPDLDRATLLGESQRPGLLDERRVALAQIQDAGQPFVGRHPAATRNLVASYELLQDRHAAPRALLGVVAVDDGALLPLPFGTVPLRGFFVAGAGLLLLLSVFLSYFVAKRVSLPIERLEVGARALSAGVLDVTVPVEEGGQIGRLTGTFNQMAKDLRERIQDLHSLNRGIVELTARLDGKEVVGSARAFCARHSAADSVRVLLRERDRVELVGHGELDAQAPELRAVLRATGAFSMQLVAGSALASACAGYRSMVGLPLVLGGRTTGAILLLFEAAVPAAVNLELLSTLAAQAAATLENARLYRQAVEDVETGALVPEPFRRLVEREVASAEAKGQSVALLALRIAGRPALATELGASGWERFLERLVGLLRQTLPPEALICRADHDELQLLLPGQTKTGALATISTILSRVRDADLGLPESALPLQLEHAEAVFPAEAASAEFLFHVLGGGAAERPPAAPLRRRLQNLRDAGIVLSSPAMQAVLHTLERVAPTDLPVLLLGETGTGKEVLADLTHAWSRRSSGPLVKVHCAALTESLLQSELFGHEKGAFTGAIARKQGRFELAHGGTIFLDEVGDISLDVQVKLLRVLQQREVERVGGSEPVPVDVRVVAATNRDIRAMVADGRFREDLYYRLQGVVVTVPPLRERRQEIPELVEAFRREAVEAGQSRVAGFSAEALDELYRRDWPGNVRELRNTVFRAIVLATGDLVKRSDLHGVPGTEPMPAPSAPVPSAPPAAGNGEPPVVLPGLAPQLPDRLHRLLALMQSRSLLAAQEYVDATGVSPRTGLRDLNQLVELGLAERLGTRRGARYRAVARSSGEKSAAPDI